MKKVNLSLTLLVLLFGCFLITASSCKKSNSPGSLMGNWGMIYLNIYYPDSIPFPFLDRSDTVYSQNEFLLQFQRDKFYFMDITASPVDTVETYSYTLIGDNKFTVWNTATNGYDTTSYIISNDTLLTTGRYNIYPYSTVTTAAYVRR